VGNQNITLSLPEEDIRAARILAASRGTSVSHLLARVLKELIGCAVLYSEDLNAGQEYSGVSVENLFRPPVADMRQ
jgi:hypothetical protein